MDSEGWGCLIWIIIGVVVFLFWDDIWYSKLRYSIECGINWNQVSIDKKPHSCDFLKAPIGKKYCYYKRIVNVTELATSKDNFPIVSYDDGKTWTMYFPGSHETVPKEPTVMGVSITWKKVSD